MTKTMLKSKKLKTSEMTHNEVKPPKITQTKSKNVRNSNLQNRDWQIAISIDGKITSIAVGVTKEEAETSANLLVKILEMFVVMDIKIMEATINGKSFPSEVSNIITAALRETVKIKKQTPK